MNALTFSGIIQKTTSSIVKKQQGLRFISAEIWKIFDALVCSAQWHVLSHRGECIIHTIDQSRAFNRTIDQSQAFNHTVDQSRAFNHTIDQSRAFITQLTNHEPLIIQLTNHKPLIIQLTNHEPLIIQLTNHEPLIMQLTNHEHLIIQLTNHKPLITQLTNHEPSIRSHAIPIFSTFVRHILLAEKSLGVEKYANQYFVSFQNFTKAACTKIL
jgi:hypothetical protein